MKRALSVATVTALSLLFCLFVGYAQEEGATAVSELLEQELAAMESAFGSLESFMGELIGEVKGNMTDIDTFNAKLDDYRDTLEAVSVELKEAEGKIIGLRADVDALGDTQQELMVRVVALEAGLSELAGFCDKLKSRLDVAVSDLGALRGEFDALATDYAAFVEASEAFREAVYGDIDALRDSIYADLMQFEESFTSGLTLVESRVEDLSIRILALEEEDVGTFKKKVIELERQMAALAIRVDNNRAKLEGFDHAIAAIAEEMTGMREGIMESNQALLAEYDARLLALEENTDLKSQIDTIMFISIVALLAGVGALIWGFLGNG
jgi:DNA repair exonuclease SbcCD ATPase subunit